MKDEVPFIVRLRQSENKKLIKQLPVFIKGFDDAVELSSTSPQRTRRISRTAAKPKKSQK